MTACFGNSSGITPVEKYMFRNTWVKTWTKTLGLQGASPPKTPTKLASAPWTPAGGNAPVPPTNWQWNDAPDKILVTAHSHIGDKSEGTVYFTHNAVPQVLWWATLLKSWWKCGNHGGRQYIFNFIHWPQTLENRWQQDLLYTVLSHITLRFSTKHANLGVHLQYMQMDAYCVNPILFCLNVKTAWKLYFKNYDSLWHLICEIWDQVLLKFDILKKHKVKKSGFLTCPPMKFKG